MQNCLQKLDEKNPYLTVCKIAPKLPAKTACKTVCETARKTTCKNNSQNVLLSLVTLGEGIQIVLLLVCVTLPKDAKASLLSHCSGYFMKTFSFKTSVACIINI